MKMLLRKSENTSPFRKIQPASIENEITGWNEIFGKTEPFIKVSLKRKHQISKIKPLFRERDSEFQQQSVEINTNSRNLSFSLNSSRLKEKNRKSQLRYNKERYTFIKKKSISQLESLMEALEPKDEKKISVTLPKFERKKKVARSPTKSISPIFTPLPSTKLSKFLNFRYKY